MSSVVESDAADRAHKSSLAVIASSLKTSATLTPDVKAVADWLNVYYEKSPQTFRAYLYEARRWLIFLEVTKGYDHALIPAAGEDDVVQYERALLDGFPHDADALLRASTRRGMKAAPFKAPLTTRSASRAIAILSAMYKFMATPINSNEAPYATHNPTKRVYKMQARVGQKVDRYFTVAVYRELLQTTETEWLEATTKQKKIQAARRKMTLTLLFGLWLRLAEAVSLSMAAFFREDGVWKLKVVGKGRKERLVIVTSSVISELNAYRRVIGLAQLRERGNEDMPVLLALRSGKILEATRQITSTALYNEVKSIASDTASRILSPNSTVAPELATEMADRLANISPHWFRHSGASDAINRGYPLHDASERLGHSGVDITGRMYYHADAKQKRDHLEMLDRART